MPGDRELDERRNSADLDATYLEQNLLLVRGFDVQVMHALVQEADAGFLGFVGLEHGECIVDFLEHFSLVAG